MKRDVVAKLHADFEASVNTERETGIEFWYGRDLACLLGYAKWENFARVILKARKSCANAGHAIKDHFLDVRRMVELGSGAKREIDDVALTRYACYLIAQNGDPAKDQIAFAQTYFAIQTRRQELIERRLSERERVQARRRLTRSEKELSGVIFERLGDQEQSFARIRSKGDQALFGGKTTLDMKNRLGVPKARPLADFLPTITIKAKDFANEITNFNIKKDDLKTERTITHEHVKNNEDVREILTERNIRPEDLPPAEDVKKVERRLEAEQKHLPSDAKPLGTTAD